MKVESQLKGVDGLINLLKSLPPEVVSKRGGPVKSALAKTARKLRDYAKQNLARSIKENGDESTGLLLKSVIASRGKPPSGGKGERYLVRVKNKAYLQDALKSTKKNRGKAKRNTTLQTANLMEYGSKRQQARPWLRPAGMQHGQELLDFGAAELVRQVDKIVKDLAKKGGG